VTAPAVARPATRYRSYLARAAADVAAAQRLRYEVFALECGARLDPFSALTRRDADEWDEHCDHLVVRDEVADEVVGTYRLLPPERAAALGRSYGDGEFDLRPHALLRPGLVEAGRSCVRAGHRNGAVISHLWAGVARYVAEGGYSHLGGCASIPLDDGGATARGVWNVVRERHLAPPGLQVRPYVPFDVDAPERPAPVTFPPLLRGYLRIGAQVCGRPAHDSAFGTADLYVLLRMSDVSLRTMRHLLGGAR
jgi:putative hemolysin